MASIAMGVVGAMLAHNLRPERWLFFALRWGGGLGIAATIVFPDVIWPRLGHGLMLVLTASTAACLIGMDGAGQLQEVRPLPGLGWLPGGALLYRALRPSLAPALAPPCAHGDLNTTPRPGPWVQQVVEFRP